MQCKYRYGIRISFTQQWKKLLPKAFEQLFQTFIARTDEDVVDKGYRLLAVDGSDIQVATNPNDPDSFFQGKEGIRPFNLIK